MEDGSTVGHKSAVKIYHAQKFPKFPLCCGLGKILNSLYLVLEWADTQTVHTMAEKIKSRNAKLALWDVDDYTMLTQAFQYQPEVVKVFLRAGAGYEEVIYVCVAKFQASEDFVHESLERLSGVSEAKGHAKSPKGAVIAVLGMSLGATGIWW